MKDKSNIAIAISLFAFFISLYSLTSTTDDEDIFTKSPNKTYISPDPEAKRKVDNIEKICERIHLLQQWMVLLNYLKQILNS